MAKRTAAGTLALAVCLGGGSLALAGAAHADSSFSFGTRVSGTDRYDTAIQSAKAAFPTGSDNVILVNGHRTVDGLTASYLAGVKNAPILYTDTDTVPTSTWKAIGDLKVKNVFIVGGTAAVSADQVSWIKGQGLATTQIGGKTRYETSQMVAAEGDHKSGKAFIASGIEGHTADALVIGAEAFKLHIPIILTGDGDTPVDGVTKELKDFTLTPILVGGTGVITAKQATAIGASESTRLFGSNRAQTAIKVAEWSWDNGFDKTSVALTGSQDKNAADALSSSPYLGSKSVPVLYAGSGDTTTYLAAKASQLTGKGYVVGGTASVSASDVTAATTAATGAQAAKGAYAVTAGATIASGDFDTTSPRTDTGRDYTASVGDATSVSVILFAASAVHVAADGTVTLDKNGAVADPGTIDGGIGFSQINGNKLASTSSTTAYGVTPKDGKITFKLNGNTSAFGDVVPVVYKGSGTSIQVDSKGTPVTDFGVGGRLTLLPAEATSAVSADTVRYIDPANKFFILGTTTANKLVQVNSDDTFTVGGSSLGTGSAGLAKFLADLSVGDTVAASTYSLTTADTFNITVDKPALPTNVAAAFVDLDADGTNDNVKLSWTNPNNYYLSSYVIQRAVVTNGTVGTFANVATPALTATNPAVSGLTTAGANVTFTDTLANLLPTTQPTTDTTYAFRIRAVGAGSGVPAGTGDATYSAPSNGIVWAAAPAAVSGVALSSTVALTTATTSLAVGDTLTFTPVSTVAVAANASIKIANELGQVATLTNGTSGNSSWTVSSGVWTITLTAPPVLVTGAAPYVNTASTGKTQIQDISGVTSGSDASVLINLRRNSTTAVMRTGGAGAAVYTAPAGTAVASTNLVTATSISAGDVVKAYDATGKTLLATSSAATTTSITFSVPNLVKGQNIILVRTAGATSLIESRGVEVSAS